MALITYPNERPSFQRSLQRHLKNVRKAEFEALTDSVLAETKSRGRGDMVLIAKQICGEALRVITGLRKLRRGQTNRRAMSRRRVGIPRANNNTNCLGCLACLKINVKRTKLPLDQPPRTAALSAKQTSAHLRRLTAKTLR